MSLSAFKVQHLTYPHRPTCTVDSKLARPPATSPIAVLGQEYENEQCAPQLSLQHRTDLTAPGQTYSRQNHNIRSMNVIPTPTLHLPCISPQRNADGRTTIQSGTKTDLRHCGEQARNSRGEHLGLSTALSTGCFRQRSNSTEFGTFQLLTASNVFWDTTPRHGSSKLLYGVRTLLIVHTASLPDNSHRSKNLKSHRPYRIIRCKKIRDYTDTNVMKKPAQSVFTD